MTDFQKADMAGAQDTITVPKTSMNLQMQVR
jgi:hypothetical protein